MFDEGEVANLLKARLPRFTSLCSSNHKAISNLTKSGNEITLTVANHGFQTGLTDYIISNNIMYKFPISKITKTNDALNGNKRFFIQLTGDHPFSDMMIGGAYEIQDVTSDTQYNGFAIIEAYYPATPSTGGISEMILQTSKNITSSEINSQGNILFPIYNTDTVKNALNGVQKITSVVDQNTIKFLLNDTDASKAEFPINTFDITSANIQSLQVFIYPSLDKAIDDKYIYTNSTDNDRYCLVIVNNGSDNSRQGITTRSQDTLEGDINGIDKDIHNYIDIFVFPKKMPQKAIGGDGNIVDNARFARERTEILTSIEKAMNTSSLPIPFSFNNGYSFTPISLGCSIDRDDGERIIWISQWKITYRVYPKDSIHDIVQTKIKSLDIKNQYNNQSISNININYE